MAYISVNLTPSDPQPGDYSLYISDCTPGSPQQLIATNLTNPTDFPYYFETTQFSGTSGSTCISYELIDTITSCSCNGDVNLVTPTPTVSFTPTPTPTLTPLSGVIPRLTVNNVFESSGGGTTTTTNVNIFSNILVDVNTTISFDLKLKDDVGSTTTQSGSLSITARESLGTTELTFSIPFADLQQGYYEFENIVCSDANAIINVNSNPLYLNNTFPPPQYTTHEWINCCNPEDTILARVLLTQTQTGGWVFNGNAVTHNGTCWVSNGPVSGQQVPLIFNGPSAQSCQTSTCTNLCSNVPNDKFAAYAKSCCPPYDVTVVTFAMDYLPEEGTIVFFDGVMYDGNAQIDPGCYTLLGVNSLNASDVIHSVSSTHPSCSSCFNYNQSTLDPCVQTNNLFRAENCCNIGEQITVQLLLNTTPILSLNPGFFYNGNCYRLLYMEQNQNSPSVVISQNSFVFNNMII